MQQLLMPLKRAELLKDKALLKSIHERLKCKIELHNSNELVIDGDSFNEYNARIVMQAFARGFEFNIACKLLSDEFFFESIDMKEAFKKEDQIKRIKARIIGKEGKTKNYIQTVSGVELVIYGNTISIIGKVNEIRIAAAAINILLEGGTHNKAYLVMEKTRRRIGE